MQSRNKLKDAAKKAMKCMSKQETPILDLHSGSAEVCVRGKKNESKYSFHFPRAEFKICSSDLFSESDHL